MTRTLKDSYFDHFIPLVRAFCDEIKAPSLGELKHLPQPFLPLFGTGYERSAFRIVIVGQDTAGCGDLGKFVANPRESIETEFRLFQERYHFVDYGKTDHYFFGFVMKFMAAVHGFSDWKVMKNRSHPEILSSFGYSNIHAIEICNHERNKTETWKAVQRAGERLNGIGHLIKTLRPRVVIVTCRMDPRAWFSGYPSWKLIGENARIRHYQILAENIDIFQVPHPSGPRSMSYQGGADHFCANLVRLIQEAKLTVHYPKFVDDGSDAEKVLSHLKESVTKRAGKPNKFEFVEWIAEELEKRKSFMSVPTLCSLLNELGYTTNNGTTFSGGRGSYKLVSGTYRRLDAAGNGERARMVARAFRKPNFEYAYVT